MFRTSNPAWRNEAFQPAQSWEDLDRQGRGLSTSGSEADAVSATRAAQRERGSTMSVQGVVNKTAFLLFLCICTSLVSWNLTTSANPVVNPLLVVFGGAIGGLITALVCCFAPKTSPVTAPLYALFQGCFVGGISAFYAMRFAHQPDADTGEGVQLNTALIFNAALLTFGILGGMLLGYKAGIIRSGPVFRRVVVTATLGALLYAVVAMVASLFGSFTLASVYDPSNGGLISIGFSLLLVGIASANLILDFDMVEVGVKNGAPRYYEWYAGFGLLVTLIWLYLEVLRLLAKLRRE